MSQGTFVLGVDLDGTCADFYEGLRPIAAEWLGVDEASLTKDVSWGFPEWGIDDAPGGYPDLHRFAVTQRELFLRLKPFPGAPMALRRLSKADVRIRIITHRLFIKSFHQTAVQQTVEWLDSHDIPYWDLCFMGDKGAVGADLYIEDSPVNIERLRQDGRPTLIFTNSTNRHLPGPHAANWDEVHQYVMGALRQFRAQRAAAAVRPPRRRQSAT